MSQFLERDIKSFGAKGNGSVNDHQAFKLAADFFNRLGGNGKLIISKGTYIVGLQTKKPGYYLLGDPVLSFNDVKNFTIVFNDGAELKLRNGLRIGSFNPANGSPFEAGRQFTDLKFLASPANIIEFRNSRNIQILNPAINGNQNTMITGGRFGDVGFQVPADGIMLANCNDVLIKGGYVKNAARDGIQIVDYREVTMKTPSKNIIIDGITCDLSGRQGLSITGGNGIIVKNSNFNNTFQGKIKSSPGSGVDVEAENSMIRDIKFINCYFINNGNTGFVADSGPSKDIYFEDCVFHSVIGWSAWTTKPNTRFNNCKFYGSIVMGYDAEREEDATVYTNCHFENLPLNGNPAYNGGGQFHLLEITYKRRQKWINCTFVSHFHRKEVSSRPFYIEGNWGNDKKVYPVWQNCNFYISIDPNKYIGQRPDYLTVAYGINYNNVNMWVYGLKENDFNSKYYFAGGHSFNSPKTTFISNIQEFIKKFPYKQPEYGNRYTPPSN